MGGKPCRFPTAGRAVARGEAPPRAPPGAPPLDLAKGQRPLGTPFVCLVFLLMPVQGGSPGGGGLRGAGEASPRASGCRPTRRLAPMGHAGDGPRLGPPQPPTGGWASSEPGGSSFARVARQDTIRRSAPSATPITGTPQATA